MKKTVYRYVALLVIPWVSANASAITLEECKSFYSDYNSNYDAYGGSSYIEKKMQTFKACSAAGHARSACIVGLGYLNGEHGLPKSEMKGYRLMKYSLELAPKGPAAGMCRAEIAFRGITEVKESSSDLEAKNLCKEAINLAGGDSSYALGFCRGSSYSPDYWNCIIAGIKSTGKRAASSNDIPSVIGYANGAGSCYGK